MKHTDLSNLPSWFLPFAIVMGAIELTLLIIGLVVLLRTPRERLTLPLPAWLAIMIVVNTLGPIAFLVAGRRPAPAAAEAPRARSGEATDRAVDELYGDR